MLQYAFRVLLVKHRTVYMSWLSYIMPVAQTNLEKVQAGRPHNFVPIKR